ncbi:MAG: DUF3999 domain-containing protein [Acidobacteria bacterium]|nr:DUF3999 domain-containing protein [Acidobacteriota bacterium]
MSRHLLVGMWLALAAGTALAQVDSPTTEQFKYQAEIRGSIRRHAVCRIPLPLELLSRSESNLTDLRLFDADGREIPFVVRFSRLQPKTTEAPLTITGYEQSRGGVQLVVTVPEAMGAVNGIELTIPERDFRKQVTVMANNAAGPVIGQDTIYDFSSYVDLRRTRVDFPATDARVLVLRITDSETMPENRDTVQVTATGLEIIFSRSWAKQLRIDTVLGRSVQAEPGGPRIDRWLLRPVPTAQNASRQTVIHVPVRLPAGRILFDVATPVFYRAVTVESSLDGRDGSWQPFASGTICAFPLGGQPERRLQLDLPGTGIARYRIAIENGDSPPLEIRSLSFESPTREIFFVADDARQPYRLMVGARSVRAPNYDIERFGDSDAWADQARNQVTMGAVTGNPDYDPQAGTSRRAQVERTVLIAVILVLVVGLGYWLFVLLRKDGVGTPSGDKPDA